MLLAKHFVAFLSLCITNALGRDFLNVPIPGIPLPLNRRFTGEREKKTNYLIDHSGKEDRAASFVAFAMNFRCGNEMRWATLSFSNAQSSVREARDHGKARETGHCSKIRIKKDEEGARINIIKWRIPYPVKRENILFVEIHIAHGVR